MKRLFATALLVFLTTTNASATGYGAYFEYGRVFDGELTNACGPCSQNRLGLDLDYSEDHYGLGLVLDTAVAKDQLFNYRVDLGYERVEANYEGFTYRYSPSTRQHGDGISLDNAFGFGIIRNSKMRLWIGPAIRLSMDFFSSGFSSDYYDFGVGGGPEIGLNVHADDRISIGMTAGYQILYSLTEFDHATVFCDRPNEVHCVKDHSDDGYEQAFVLKLLVLFRTGDDQFSSSE